MPYYLHPLLFAETWVQSHHFSIDHYLLVAVIMAESGGNPHAVGDDRHSFGLMQLHIQGAGSNYTPAQLLSPSLNIEVGAGYLRSCLDAFPGDEDRAIAAYNAGIGAMQQSQEIFNIGYVRSVRHWQAQLQAEGMVRWAQESDMIHLEPK